MSRFSLGLLPKLGGTSAFRCRQLFCRGGRLPGVNLRPGKVREQQPERVHMAADRPQDQSAAAICAVGGRHVAGRGVRHGRDRAQSSGTGPTGRRRRRVRSRAPRPVRQRRASDRRAGRDRQLRAGRGDNAEVRRQPGAGAGAAATPTALPGPLGRARTSEDTDDCGSEADLVLLAMDINTLATAAGGFGVDHTSVLSMQ